jgi:Tol biopolymer transport system component
MLLLARPLAAVLAAVTVASVSGGVVVHRANSLPPQVQSVQQLTADATPTAPRSLPPEPSRVPLPPSPVPTDLPLPARSPVPAPVPQLPRAPASRATVIDEEGIWIVETDGSGARRVVPGGSMYADWVSGDRIAYLQDASLWVTSVDGAHRRKIVSGSSARFVYEFDVSPDGEWIAFLWGSSSAVHIVGSDGTGLRQVSDKGMTGLTVAWSPDGRTLAYVRSARNDGGLYTYDLASRKSVRIRPGGLGSSPLAWTADGSEIAFVSGTNGAAISVIAADGSATRNLKGTAYNATYFDLEPGGRRLLYNQPYTPALWEVDLDKGGPRKLRGNAESAAWSPTGDRIALVSRTGEIDGARWVQELAMAKPDMSGWRRLLGTGSDTHLSGVRWSADGRLIVKSSIVI